MAAEITRWIADATGGSSAGRDGLVRRFAEKAGTSPSNVSRWREGTIPGPSFRPGLARALGRTITDVESACQLTPGRGGNAPTAGEQAGDSDLDQLLATILGKLNENQQAMLTQLARIERKLEASTPPREPRVRAKRAPVTRA